MIRFLTGQVAAIQRKNPLQRMKSTGRFGEGRREETFEFPSSRLAAHWKQDRIEARFTVDQKTELSSLELLLRFHSPRSRSELDFWSETLDDAQESPGAWALWLSESRDSEGIFLWQQPGEYGPVHFRRSGAHGIRIIWSIQGSVSPEHPMDLVPIRITRGSRAKVMELWRRAWSADARSPSVDRRLGWQCSATVASPKDVRECVSTLRIKKARVEWVALGSGYASNTGDWLQPSEDFRDRMGNVARSIQESHYVPGLRFAPFLVSKRSQIATTKPEWLLMNQSGKPVSVAPYEENDEPTYVLDITHPGVEEHLNRVLLVMRDQWGFRAFVMERVTDALTEGRRFNQSVVAGAELNRLLDGFRRNVGNKVLLVGAGVPFLMGHRVWDALRVTTTAGGSRGVGNRKKLMTMIRRTLERSQWKGSLSHTFGGSIDVQHRPKNIKDRIALEAFWNAAALCGGMMVFSGAAVEWSDESWRRMDRLIDLFLECRDGRLEHRRDSRKNPTWILRNSAGWIGLYNLRGSKREILINTELLEKLGTRNALAADGETVFNSPEVHVAVAGRGHRLFRA